MDRVLPSEGRGCGFDPRRARHSCLFLYARVPVASHRQPCPLVRTSLFCLPLYRQKFRTLGQHSDNHTTTANFPVPPHGYLFPLVDKLQICRNYAFPAQRPFLHTNLLFTQRHDDAYRQDLSNTSHFDFPAFLVLNHAKTCSTSGYIF